MVLDREYMSNLLTISHVPSIHGAMSLWYIYVDVNLDEVNITYHENTRRCTPPVTPPSAGLGTWGTPVHGLQT
jgi:hypothetical protein